MELKTLKDISAQEWKNRKHFVELWVKVDELKQSAINDIKELQKGFDSAGKLCIENYAKIDYIKWKFNIIDEDLKKK